MIAVLALVARVLLAAVFAVAGAAKLRDRPGTRQAVVDFGAPERLAGPLAVLLPLAELVTAALLLVPATAVAGAIGALVLLAIFSAAIAINLAHGRTPDCHCFGQLHSAPAGWKTLVRNTVLAGVAVFALVGTLAEPDASGIGWIRRLDGAELLALAVGSAAIVLLVLGALAFLTLMRSYGNVLVRLDRLESALAEAGIDLGEIEEMPEAGLEPGTPAPAFTASTLAGETVALDTLLAPGVPTLLLFTSPRCGPCKTLLPTAAEWQREHADALKVVFVSDGAADEIRAEAEEFELEHVLLDGDLGVYTAYQANGTPSAVLISPDGAIASWMASGVDWIEQLVRGALQRDEDEEPGLPMGADAPGFELPTLEGERVSLSDLQGKATLLLFWNPNCGFCRSMHDDLLAWERTTNGREPQLVVISSGEETETRAEGFSSQVLLDADYAAGTAFGANGTPMAVLVGADGRIASEVVAGADAVLSLANTANGP